LLIRLYDHIVNFSNEQQISPPPTSAPNSHSVTLAKVPLSLSMELYQDLLWFVSTGGNLNYAYKHKNYFLHSAFQHHSIIPILFGLYFGARINLPHPISRSTPLNYLFHIANFQNYRQNSVYVLYIALLSGANPNHCSPHHVCSPLTVLLSLRQTPVTVQMIKLLLAFDAVPCFMYSRPDPSRERHLIDNTEDKLLFPLDDDTLPPLRHNFENIHPPYLLPLQQAANFPTNTHNDPTFRFPDYKPGFIVPGHIYRLNPFTILLSNYSFPHRSTAIEMYDQTHDEDSALAHNEDPNLAPSLNNNNRLSPLPPSPLTNKADDAGSPYALPPEVIAILVNPEQGQILKKPKFTGKSKDSLNIKEAHVRLTRQLPNDAAQQSSARRRADLQSWHYTQQFSAHTDRLIEIFDLLWLKTYDIGYWCQFDQTGPLTRKQVSTINDRESFLHHQIDVLRVSSITKMFSPDSQRLPHIRLVKHIQKHISLVYPLPHTKRIRIVDPALRFGPSLSSSLHEESPKATAVGPIVFPSPPPTPTQGPRDDLKKGQSLPPQPKTTALTEIEEDQKRFPYIPRWRLQQKFMYSGWSSSLKPHRPKHPIFQPGALGYLADPNRLIIMKQLNYFYQIQYMSHFRNNQASQQQEQSQPQQQPQPQPQTQRASLTNHKITPQPNPQTQQPQPPPQRRENYSHYTSISRGAPGFPPLGFTFAFSPRSSLWSPSDSSDNSIIRLIPDFGILSTDDLGFQLIQAQLEANSDFPGKFIGPVRPPLQPIAEELASGGSVRLIGPPGPSQPATPTPTPISSPSPTTISEITAEATKPAETIETIPPTVSTAISATPATPETSSTSAVTATAAPTTAVTMSATTSTTPSSTSSALSMSSVSLPTSPEPLTPPQPTLQPESQPQQQPSPTPGLPPLPLPSNNSGLKAQVSVPNSAPSGQNPYDTRKPSPRDTLILEAKIKRQIIDRQARPPPIWGRSFHRAAFKAATVLIELILSHPQQFEENTYFLLEAILCEPQILSTFCKSNDNDLPAYVLAAQNNDFNKMNALIERYESDNLRENLTKDDFSRSLVTQPFFYFISFMFQQRHLLLNYYLSKQSTELRRFSRHFHQTYHIEHRIHKPFAARQCDFMFIYIYELFLQLSVPLPHDWKRFENRFYMTPAQQDVFLSLYKDVLKNPTRESLLRLKDMYQTGSGPSAPIRSKIFTPQQIHAFNLHQIESKDITYAQRQALIRLRASRTVFIMLERGYCQSFHFVKYLLYHYHISANCDIVIHKHLLSSYINALASSSLAPLWKSTTTRAFSLNEIPLLDPSLNQASTKQIPLTFCADPGPSNIRPLLLSQAELEQDDGRRVDKLFPPPPKPPTKLGPLAEATPEQEATPLSSPTPQNGSHTPLVGAVRNSGKHIKELLSNTPLGGAKPNTTTSPDTSAPSPVAYTPDNPLYRRAHSLVYNVHGAASASLLVSRSSSAIVLETPGATAAGIYPLLSTFDRFGGNDGELWWEIPEVPNAFPQGRYQWISVNRLLIHENNLYEARQRQRKQQLLQQSIQQKYEDEHPNISISRSPSMSSINKELSVWYNDPLQNIKPPVFRQSVLRSVNVHNVDFSHQGADKSKPQELDYLSSYLLLALAPTQTAKITPTPDGPIATVAKTEYLPSYLKNNRSGTHHVVSEPSVSHSFSYSYNSAHYSTNIRTTLSPNNSYLTDHPEHVYHLSPTHIWRPKRDHSPSKLCPSVSALVMRPSMKGEPTLLASPTVAQADWQDNIYRGGIDQDLAIFRHHATEDYYLALQAKHYLIDERILGIAPPSVATSSPKDTLPNFPVVNNRGNTITGLLCTPSPRQKGLKTQKESSPGGLGLPLGSLGDLQLDVTQSVAKVPLLLQIPNSNHPHVVEDIGGGLSVGTSIFDELTESDDLVQEEDQLGAARSTVMNFTDSNPPQAIPLGFNKDKTSSLLNALDPHLFRENIMLLLELGVDPSDQNYNQSRMTMFQSELEQQELFYRYEDFSARLDSAIEHGSIEPLVGVPVPTPKFISPASMTGCLPYDLDAYVLEIVKRNQRKNKALLEDNAANPNPYIPPERYLLQQDNWVSTAVWNIIQYLFVAYYIPNPHNNIDKAHHEDKDGHGKRNAPNYKDSKERDRDNDGMPGSIRSLQFYYHFFLLLTQLDRGRQPKKDIQLAMPELGSILGRLHEFKSASPSLLQVYYRQFKSLAENYDISPVEGFQHLALAEIFFRPDLTTEFPKLKDDSQPSIKDKHVSNKDQDKNTKELNNKVPTTINASTTSSNLSDLNELSTSSSNMVDSAADPNAPYLVTDDQTMFYTLMFQTSFDGVPERDRTPPSARQRCPPLSLVQILLSKPIYSAHFFKEFITYVLSTSRANSSEFIFESHQLADTGLFSMASYFEFNQLWHSIPYSHYLPATDIINGTLWPLPEHSWEVPAPETNPLSPSYSPLRTHVVDRTHFLPGFLIPDPQQTLICSGAQSGVTKPHNILGLLVRDPGCASSLLHPTYYHWLHITLPRYLTQLANTIKMLVANLHKFLSEQYVTRITQVIHHCQANKHLPEPEVDSFVRLYMEIENWNIFVRFFKITKRTFLNEISRFFDRPINSSAGADAYAHLITTIIRLIYPTLNGFHAVSGLITDRYLSLHKRRRKMLERCANPTWDILGKVLAASPFFSITTDFFVNVIILNQPLTNSLFFTKKLLIALSAIVNCGLAIYFTSDQQHFAPAKKSKRSAHSLSGLPIPLTTAHLTGVYSLNTKPIPSPPSPSSVFPFNLIDCHSLTLVDLDDDYSDYTALTHPPSSMTLFLGSNLSCAAFGLGFDYLEPELLSNHPDLTPSTKSLIASVALLEAELPIKRLTHDGELIHEIIDIFLNNNIRYFVELRGLFETAYLSRHALPVNIPAIKRLHILTEYSLAANLGSMASPMIQLSQSRHMLTDDLLLFYIYCIFNLISTSTPFSSFKLKTIQSFREMQTDPTSSVLYKQRPWHIYKFLPYSPDSSFGITCPFLTIPVGIPPPTQFSPRAPPPQPLYPAPSQINAPRVTPLAPVPVSRGYTEPSPPVFTPSDQIIPDDCYFSPITPNTYSIDHLSKCTYLGPSIHKSIEEYTAVHVSTFFDLLSQFNGYIFKIANSPPEGQENLRRNNIVKSTADILISRLQMNAQLKLVLLLTLKNFLTHQHPSATHLSHLTDTPQAPNRSDMFGSLWYGEYSNYFSNNTHYDLIVDCLLIRIAQLDLIDDSLCYPEWFMLVQRQFDAYKQTIQANMDEELACANQNTNERRTPNIRLVSQHPLALPPHLFYGRRKYRYNYQLLPQQYSLYARAQAEIRRLSPKQWFHQAPHPIFPPAATAPPPSSLVVPPELFDSVTRHFAPFGGQTLPSRLFDFNPNQAARVVALYDHISAAEQSVLSSYLFNTPIVTQATLITLHKLASFGFPFEQGVSPNSLHHNYYPFPTKGLSITPTNIVPITANHPNIHHSRSTSTSATQFSHTAVNRMSEQTTTTMIPEHEPTRVDRPQLDDSRNHSKEPDSLTLDNSSAITSSSSSFISTNVSSMATLGQSSSPTVPVMQGLYRLHLESRLKYFIHTFESLQLDLEETYNKLAQYSREDLLFFQNPFFALLRSNRHHRVNHNYYQLLKFLTADMKVSTVPSPRYHPYELFFKNVRHLTVDSLPTVFLLFSIQHPLLIYTQTTSIELFQKQLSQFYTSDRKIFLTNSVIDSKVLSFQSRWAYSDLPRESSRPQPEPIQPPPSSTLSIFSQPWQQPSQSTPSSSAGETPTESSHAVFADSYFDAEFDGPNPRLADRRQNRKDEKRRQEALMRLSRRIYDMFFSQIHYFPNNHLFVNCIQALASHPQQCLRDMFFGYYPAALFDQAPSNNSLLSQLFETPEQPRDFLSPHVVWDVTPTTGQPRLISPADSFISPSVYTSSVSLRSLLLHPRRLHFYKTFLHSFTLDQLRSQSVPGIIFPLRPEQRYPYHNNTPSIYDSPKLIYFAPVNAHYLDHVPNPYYQSSTNRFQYYNQYYLSPPSFNSNLHNLGSTLSNFSLFLSQLHAQSGVHVPQFSQDEACQNIGLLWFLADHCVPSIDDLYLLLYGLYIDFLSDSMADISYKIFKPSQTNVTIAHPPIPTSQHFSNPYHQQSLTLPPSALCLLPPLNPNVLNRQGRHLLFYAILRRWPEIQLQIMINAIGFEATMSLRDINGKSVLDTFIVFGVDDYAKEVYQVLRAWSDYRSCLSLPPSPPAYRIDSNAQIQSTIPVTGGVSLEQQGKPARLDPNMVKRWEAAAAQESQDVSINEDSATSRVNLMHLFPTIVAYLQRNITDFHRPLFRMRGYTKYRA
jgi:hypothetical protein